MCLSLGLFCISSYSVNMTSLSIITTVLNDKDNIENCIYAVQNQNINNIEHIIVDGGSNDGTIKILKHLKKK